MSFRSPLVSVVGCLVAFSVQTAQADPFNVPFDTAVFDTPTATFSPDAFRQFGMVADASFTLCNVALIQPDAYDQYLAAGGTPPAALLLASMVSQFQLELSFVVPDTDIAASTDSVSFLFFDTNVGTMAGWIEAYDVKGKLLGRAEAITPENLLTTLTLSYEGIHRIRIGTDLDGAIIDNFTTGSLVAIPVPAPGAAIILIGSLLGGRRRRRR